MQFFLTQNNSFLTFFVIKFLNIICVIKIIVAYLLYPKTTRNQDELKSQQNVLCHFGYNRGWVAYCLNNCKTQYISKSLPKNIGRLFNYRKMQNLNKQYKSQMNKSLQMNKMFTVALICAPVC
ncbi:hypothetical protein HYN56_07730 [Flavobacterium crocinum]|uniref:Transmembrane protein n=1 Tax=Flavobacterium crocinum TaxID=2183896 RepID=A0A2S1YJD0_9FLAO|nr:hypothetical protein HYN56_07730 [Flavobacterium crocinum]